MNRPSGLLSSETLAGPTMSRYSGGAASPGAVPVPLNRRRRVRSQVFERPHVVQVMPVSAWSRCTVAR